MAFGGNGADIFQVTDGSLMDIADFNLGDGDVLRLSASETFEIRETSSGLFFDGAETDVFLRADADQIDDILEQGVEFF